MINIVNFHLYLELLIRSWKAFNKPGLTEFLNMVLTFYLT